MVQVLKRPTVVDFIDCATVENGLGLRMEEVLLTERSAIVGKKIMDSGLRKEFDVIAVAVKKASGTMVFNPKPTEILEVGDLLVIIGMKDDLDRLNAIL